MDYRRRVLEAGLGERLDDAEVSEEEEDVESLEGRSRVHSRHPREAEVVAVAPDSRAMVPDA